MKEVLIFILEAEEDVENSRKPRIYWTSRPTVNKENPMQTQRKTTLPFCGKPDVGKIPQKSFFHIGTVFDRFNIFFHRFLTGRKTAEAVDKVTG